MKSNKCNNALGEAKEEQEKNWEEGPYQDWTCWKVMFSSLARRSFSALEGWGF